MKTTNRLSIAAVAITTVLGASYAVYAVPEVSNVTMVQRANSRVVDIGYALSGEAAIVTVSIETNGVAIPDGAVTRLSGDVSVVVQPGSRSIMWNAGADWPEHSVTNARARVKAWQTNSPPLYCVVDLSAGYATNFYPVTYYVSAEALPDGGLTNDLYRTVRLVMRRIRTQAPYPENGVFMMGSPVSETGRIAASEDWHQVTLTKDYFMGVFGVTQGQWQQVMNARPSTFNNADYWMARPVEMVSYADIRGSSVGAGWPASRDVDAASFIGFLRAKTGLQEFDLPTEAQWEYACRAGTSGALNDGTVNLTNINSDARLSVLGRYSWNGGRLNGTTDPATNCTPANATATVGSYAPNTWGLYDMHGNVWEWCLDWQVDHLGTGAVTDPPGATSGSRRVVRGGSWFNPAYYSRSAAGYRDLPSTRNYSFGFRLARTLP